MNNRIFDFRGAIFSSIAILLVFSIALTRLAVKYCHGEELYISAAGTPSTEKIVILDAGHGGEDCGAIGYTGVYEKDINLNVAMIMGEELKKQGYAVVYTRTDDKLLYKDEENIKGIRKISDLKNRCAVAKSYPTAIFISIHMNSFGDERYSGLQVYYSETNAESKVLAEGIQKGVREGLQTSNKRTVKGGKGLYILENVDNPAVLVECGFLSNKAECVNLSEKEYQKQLSFLIVCAIIEYMENTVA